MRKLLLFVLTLTVTLLQAKQVDVDKAKDIALKFMTTGTMAKANVPNKTALKLVYTATGNKETEASTVTSANDLFYVFNLSDNEGFVIVAADDAVSPILAYSRGNSFNADKVPCNVKAVLDTYRNAITEAIANGTDASGEWANIAKTAEAATEGDFLVKSKWNQFFPYNEQTPILAGEHCATGCVATAMAQIMYYWKQPSYGTGSHEYYWYGGGKTLSADFSEPFDWTNMHDTYDYDSSYTQEEIDAISHLLLQCGISVNMSYYDESAASTTTMRNSLCKYFGYNETTACSYSLSDVGETEWMRIIKEEIDNGRPIVYASSSHAFICDGYDSNDYLHVNFGWGGFYDGFYQHMGTNEYLNGSYQSMECGLMPSDKSSQVKDYVETQSFTCGSDNDTEEPGTCLSFYITLKHSENKEIEAVSVVKVDKDNNILENLGITKNTSTSDERYYAQCQVTNLNNDSEDDAEYIFMPAYKVAGEWKVATDATPIVKKVLPLISCNPTNLYMSFYSNRKTKQVGDKYRQDIIFKPNDENFKGTIEITVNNEAGKTVYTQTSKVVMMPGTWTPLPVDYVFMEAGTYTFNVVAYDVSGVKFKAASLDLLVYGETYLTEFGYDPSKYDKVAELYPNAMVFAPNTTVHLKANFHNPTNELATKTYVVANLAKYYDSVTASSVLAENIVTIPANGDASVYFDVVANKANTSSNAYFVLKEKQDDGTYEFPTTDLTATSTPNSYIRYRIETPQMIFSKAPTVNDEDTLILYANSPSWMTFYLQVQDAGLTQTVGYSLIARLYDGSNKVGECKAIINAIDDYDFSSVIDGFDVTPGKYTIKFALDQMGTEYEVRDASGSVAAYTVEVKGQNLLPQQSHILNGSENYLFSANSSALYKGKTAKLKFALTNPHSSKFIGTIKVKEYNRQETPCVQSDEKRITIEGDNGENIYGEISITVPANYSYSWMPFALYAKSQYDDDYRAISDAIYYATITNQSGICNATIDNGVTIAEGKITVGGRIKNTSVYDVQGSLVNGYTVSGNTIDLQSLQSGVYVVNIDIDGEEPIKVKVVR